MDRKKLKKLLKNITELIASARASDPNQFPTRISQSGALVFSGDSVAKYNSVSEALWAADYEIHQTVSLKTVTKELDELVLNCLKTGATLTVSHIEQLFKRLIDLKKEDYKIFRSVEGATLSSPSPLQLGPFILYDWKKHQTELPGAEDPILWKGLQQGVLVSVQVSARDQDRAVELADEQFRRFESAIRYMIADKEGKFDAGIFDYRYQAVLRFAGISPSWRFNGAQLIGPILPVDLADTIFTDHTQGHDWVWKTLSKPNPTDLEQRILAAIEWFGKGVRDPDLAKAFVQFIFSLEALLTFQKKGMFVSPSIAQQLAEFAAFIAGNSLDDKLCLEKSVKELYAKRSAIAHGRDRSVSKDELLKAMQLLKRIITKLVTDPKLLALNSVDDLQDWVQQQKYS